MESRQLLRALLVQAAHAQPSARMRLRLTCASLSIIRITLLAFVVVVALLFAFLWLFLGVVWAPLNAVALWRRWSFARWSAMMALATLDEADLDEQAGIGAGTTDITTYYCDWVPTAAPASGPIDWDCSGAASGVGVVEDITGDGSLQSLDGFDDWSYLRQSLQYPDQSGQRSEGARHEPGSHPCHPPL